VPADTLMWGGMAEWTKAAVLKTARGASPSRVRIPFPPHPTSGFTKEAGLTCSVTAVLRNRARGYRVPNFSSIRLSASSTRSSLSLDSALPRWISSAARTTKENSWRNSDCQFSSVD
jgi:hypothetical protein